MSGHKESEIAVAYDNLRRALQTLDNCGEDLHLVEATELYAGSSGGKPQFIAGRSRTMARIDGEWQSKEIPREETDYGKQLESRTRRAAGRAKEPAMMEEFKNAAGSSDWEWLYVAPAGKKNFPSWEYSLMHERRRLRAHVGIIEGIFRVFKVSGPSFYGDYTTAAEAIKVAERLMSEAINGEER